MQRILLVYFLIVNFIGFVLMGVDKRKAKKNRWRIPEKTLFLMACIGGSLGTTLGMHYFHHKTKHWYFLWGMPAILFLQMGLFVYLRFFLLK